MDSQPAGDHRLCFKSYPCATVLNRHVMEKYQSIMQNFSGVADNRFMSGQMDLTDIWVQAVEAEPPNPDDGGGETSTMAQFINMAKALEKMYLTAYAIDWWDSLLEESEQRVNPFVHDDIFERRRPETCRALEEEERRIRQEVLPDWRIRIVIDRFIVRDYFLACVNR